MSDKEKRRRNQCKFVCEQCWVYMKKSSIISLSLAMKISWLKLKSRIRERFSKVRGVTFENRQQLLSNLSKCRKEDIVLSFNRDYENPHKWAIEINCYIKGIGEVSTLGYVSKELSPGIGAAMDAGALVVPMLERVTGGYREGYAFGLNFSYIIVK